MQPSSQPSSAAPPSAALALGYAGLIPFVGAVAAAALGDAGQAAIGRDALLLYGGVILSFMGGCRWGFAAAGLGPGPSFAALSLSVLPALAGFAVLLARAVDPALINFPAAAAALALGFAALFMTDRAATRSGAAPGWWTSLRAPLTLGACASLISAALI